MAFRQTYSRVSNEPESRVESALEAIISIESVRVGRCQGLRINGRTNNRPVNEIGSDRAIEFVAGMKGFQGTLQSMAIVYGDLVKRIASASGGSIDPDSYASTLSNIPEFSISVFRRGTPSYGSPTAYASPTGSQELAGGGKLVKTLVGCSIDSFESGINANDSLIMESVSFSFIDLVISPDKLKSNVLKTI